MAINLRKTFLCHPPQTDAIKLANEKMMVLTCHVFGEDICNLLSSGDVQKSNNFVVKYLLNRVAVNLYVLHALVIDKVNSNLDGINVFIMQQSKVNVEETKLCEETMQLDDLEQVTYIARYSALMDDLKMQSYFLHFQEIKALPRNKHHPVVNFLVFRQPPNQHRSRLVTG